jgi:1-acyl-sn-glycerol-3-phosphate acyltransferase
MTPRRRAVRHSGRPGVEQEGAAVTEAQIIPLRADGAGVRLPWRPGAPVEGAPETPSADVPEPEFGDAAPPPWEEVLADFFAFLRRRLAGEYAVDDFGFDPDLTDNVILPALRPLYRNWFRVETIGIHHVPDVGGALVVANHSGTLPLDSLMAAVALHDEHPAQRHLRMLGADLMFRLPVVGALARKQGSTLACNPDAERLMSSGELVGVWPEGFKGIGKPFRDRYKLQRFGRGGFVSAALRTGVPIIPCSIVGAEEIYPKIGEIKPLARLLGAPYFPITPLFPLFGPLGLVPLPSKWYIEFGEPIRTDAIGAAEADDPMTVFNLTDQVRETIQHTLYRLLSQRRNAFLG